MSETKMLGKKLDKKWFELVKSGAKTVEGRINRDDWKNLYDDWKSSVPIKFTCDGEFTVKMITKIVIYNSFAELLEKEGESKVLPGHTYDEALSVYNKIYPGNTEKVLAIHLKSED